MNLEIFDQIANLSIFIAWVPSALFIFFYGKFSPWRATVVGRSVMYLAISIFFLLTLGISANWFDDYTFEPIVRALIYGGVTINLWRLFYALRLAQTGRVSARRPDYHPFRAAIDKVKGRSLT